MIHHNSFNIFSDVISFDGEKLLFSYLTGDLIIKFNNNQQIGWIPTPYKPTLEVNDIKNYGFSYISIDTDKIVLIHKFKDLYISKYNITKNRTEIMSVINCIITSSTNINNIIQNF